MCTSEPTSDSSDAGGSGKSNDDPSSVNKDWDASSQQLNITSENDNTLHYQTPEEKESDTEEKNNDLESNDNIAHFDNVRNIFNVISSLLFKLVKILLTIYEWQTFLIKGNGDILQQWCTF